jgi:hypothetical protein
MGELKQKKELVNEKPPFQRNFNFQDSINDDNISYNSRQRNSSVHSSKVIENVKF